MKTLVDIEPELYAAAERLAQAQQKSLGQVLSELLRRAVGLSAEPEGALTYTWIHAAIGAHFDGCPVPSLLLDSS